jgi:hypothetical protein
MQRQCFKPENKFKCLTAVKIHSAHRILFLVVILPRNTLSQLGPDPFVYAKYPYELQGKSSVQRVQGEFPGVKCPGVKLITQHQSVPRLRMSGAVTPLTLRLPDVHSGNFAITLPKRRKIFFCKKIKTCFCGKVFGKKLFKFSEFVLD